MRGVAAFALPRGIRSLASPSASPVALHPKLGDARARPSQLPRSPPATASASASGSASAVATSVGIAGTARRPAFAPARLRQDVTTRRAVPTHARGVATRAQFAEAMPASAKRTALADAPVAVVSTRACPYCKRAKEALTDAGIAWADIDVSSDETLRAKVLEATGSRTVPQIFVGGKSIGGSDDLAAALADGTFQAAAKAASPPALPSALLELARAAAAAAAKAAAAEADSASRGGELRALVADMSASSGGLSRVGGAAVAAPFAGAAAVDWIAGRWGCSRDAALATANALLAENLIAPHRPAGSSGGAAAPRGAGAASVSAPALSEKQRYVLVSELPLRPQDDSAPLNARFEWSGGARPATQVATQLRGLILELYEKHLTSDGRSVSYKAMKTDPLFRRYVDATAELQALDLAPLNVPELTALFINLYNALIVHALVVLGAPDGTLSRLKFFGAAKYNIGGQQYSADDIENGVLRGNRAPASALWSLLGFPRLAKGQFSRKADDPRAKYICPKVDPRIHFALVCGAKSCPPIKLYTPDNLDEGLTAAGEAFCASEVSVDKRARAVTVSMIFKWYAPDFGADEVERLRWISQFLRGAAKADLDAMLAAPDGGRGIKLQYKKYDWDLNGE